MPVLIIQSNLNWQIITWLFYPHFEMQWEYYCLLETEEYVHNETIIDYIVQMLSLYIYEKKTLYIPLVLCILRSSEWKHYHLFTSCT